MNTRLNHFITFFLIFFPMITYSQEMIKRDTVVYNFTYRDTVIYRYDTIRIQQYIYSDTLKMVKPIVERPGTTVVRNRKLNPTNWGIGPSAGVLYSNHGFDAYIGFGVQYYMFAIPSFRNPHMGKTKR